MDEDGGAPGPLSVPRDTPAEALWPHRTPADTKPAPPPSSMAGSDTSIPYNDSWLSEKENRNEEGSALAFVSLARSPRTSGCPTRRERRRVVGDRHRGEPGRDAPRRSDLTLRSTRAPNNAQSR